MGQRLVVTIHNNNKEIAKVYYHWSAYSYDAFLEAQRIVKCIYNHKDETEKELKLRLIRFCEANGGGIDGAENEFERIQAMYPNETFKKEGHSRNYGLIALSEEGMEQLQFWSEGDLDIYIDDDKICNGVYNYYESLEEYNKEMQECDDEFEPLTLDDIPDIGYDISDIDVEDLNDIIEELRNVDGVCRYGNEIFELVE